ncbi:MAG TPA: aquaporin [Gemmatimonadales bacterium]|nr:aquaporin [Gemmatimonadales bacterium]
MRSLARPLLVEALGTFLLVFAAVAAMSANPYPGAGFNLLGIALASGVAFGLAVTVALPYSGGHVNPAVTVGMLIGGRIDAARAGLYVVAQLVGAVVGAIAVNATFPAGVTRVLDLGVPSIHTAVTMSGAICLEAVMTFVLMTAYYATIVSPRATRMAGWGVGLAVFAMMLVGAPLTGAAMNPARAFGPALVAGQWTGHIAYWVGPILGAGIAALVWEKFLLAGEKR